MSECDRSGCGKPAVLNFVQVSHGAKRTKRLCGDCARESGILPPETTPLAKEEELETLRAALREKPPCPSCGLSEELLGFGRAGCAHCYDHFSELLEEMALRFHRTTEHVGKVHRSTPASEARAERMEVLQVRLSAAIEAERYETAAKIRDHIRALEGARR